jgi:glycosyltransferase involved in cell wall biosynthesis
MRIVQLIDDLSCGGAEQVVASLASCLSRRGHSVRVVCLRDVGPNPVDVSALLKDNVDIVTLEKPPGFHFVTLRKLRAYLKDQRIEVIHTHNHLVHHYGAVAARCVGTPVILNTLHGAASLQMSAWVAKALFGLSCLISDSVVSVCPQVHTILRETFRLPMKKLCVVDNGADLSRFLFIPRRPPGEVVTFGNIGRLEPIKDHKNLLVAFALLWKRHPNVQLRILGDGALRQELEQLARTLSIADDVHFEGFSLDTARFLSSIDVYAISSRSEGLPLTLLEAMGAALPIVSTAVGAIPDILGKAQCGWLCPPCDADELANSMEKALQAPNLSAIGAQSRKAVEEYYSIERMAQDYERLYEVFLSQQSPANP